MKIAIPYENSQVFAHFGKTAQFKFYTVDEFDILSEEIVTTDGAGHAVLADFLKEQNVNMVICGGIGTGAVVALREAGIQLMGGTSGEADQQVKDFLNGKLHFEADGFPGPTCSSGCGGHGSHSEEEIEGNGNISACGNCCH